MRRLGFERVVLARELTFEEVDAIRVSLDVLQAVPDAAKVLSEIARDVLRRGVTGPLPSAPEPTPPSAASEDRMTEVESAADPTSPSAPLAPAREGITVPIPPEAAPPKKVVPKEATAGYQSNSWCQVRPDTARALRFSSGVLAPASAAGAATLTPAFAT